MLFRDVGVEILFGTELNIILIDKKKQICGLQFTTFSSKWGFFQSLESHSFPFFSGFLRFPADFSTEIPVFPRFCMDLRMEFWAPGPMVQTLAAKSRRFSDQPFSVSQIQDVQQILDKIQQHIITHMTYIKTSANIFLGTQKYQEPMEKWVDSLFLVGHPTQLCHHVSEYGVCPHHVHHC